MASLLNNLCIGQYQATMLVFTRLNQSCQPLAGQNDQVRTSCFASIDAQPQYDDGIEYGRRSSDGLRCFYVRDCNKFKQIDLTIGIITWDMELLELSTGADLFVGKSGTPWVGKSMGFGMPGGDDACPSGVAIEVYTKAAYGTGGFCVTTAAGAPVFVRHLFPFARLAMTQITADDNNDGILLSLTGFGLPNANWGNGPNNDWPSSVDMADNSPYAAVFTSMLPDSTCGYTTATSTALSEAVFWIDADDVTDAAQQAPNRGTGGSALNARYGTLIGLDASDPKWLPGDDQGGYLYQPGTASSANYMSFPDNGTTFTGDMSIAVRVDPDDRNLNSTYVLKREAAIDGALVPFNFVGGLTPGALGFTWYDSVGAIHQLYTSTVVPVSAKWIGVQHDINNGAGGNTARFYWSNDGSAWTLLATVTEAAVATRRVNTAKIGIAGTDAGGAGTPGLYRQVKMWNSLTFEGTPQVNVNMATDIVNEGALASFTCTSGQTVTVNRSTTGRKATVTRVGGRAKWLFGTDDYMEVSDNALLDFAANESFTMMAVVRQWPTATAHSYIDKATIPNPITGYRLGITNNIVGDGVLTPTTGSLAPPDGILCLVAMVRDVATDTVYRYVNGTAATSVTDTTTATLANTLPLRIGKDSSGSNNVQEFVLVAAAIWRRVLTTSELSEIQAFYGATGTV